MPKLKKLVLYTNDGRNELSKLERQKQRYCLPDLKIFTYEFATFFLVNDPNINEPFMNYPMMERVNWEVFFDYELLFKRFRILPGDFFTKFPKIGSLKIGKVTNYKHLFGFLKHCPRLESLAIWLSKIREIRFLDQLFLLTPALLILTIMEDHPPALFDYDYTFLSSLKVILVRLECKQLPDTFFGTVYQRCKYLRCVQLYRQDHISMMVNKDANKLGLLANHNSIEYMKLFLTFEELTFAMLQFPLISKT